MTREEFIKILDEEGYSYEIEGDKIVVTYEGAVYLISLKALPPDVEFRNEGHVYLGLLVTLPPGVEFRNGGNVYLLSLVTLPPGVEFRNGGDCYMMLGWLHEWQGNVPGVRDKSLLNLMIRRGMFL